MTGASVLRARLGATLLGCVLALPMVAQTPPTRQGWVTDNAHVLTQTSARGWRACSTAITATAVTRWPC